MLAGDGFALVLSLPAMRDYKVAVALGRATWARYLDCIAKLKPVGWPGAKGTSGSFLGFIRTLAV